MCILWRFAFLTKACFAVQPRHRFIHRAYVIAEINNRIDEYSSKYSHPPISRSKSKDPPTNPYFPLLLFYREAHCFLLVASRSLIFIFCLYQRWHRLIPQLESHAVLDKVLRRYRVENGSVSNYRKFKS